MNANQPESWVPVARPSLPDANALLPYLRRIDATGWYSNHGPLEEELRTRVSATFGYGADQVVTASSGTAGLIATLQEVTSELGRERRKVILPDFTFVATGMAVLQAGFIPVLAPVCSTDWQLQPDTVRNTFDLDDVAAVIPVGAFGAAVDQLSWQEFRRQTGVQVVFDLAPGWECAANSPGTVLGEIPVIFSMHATKVLTSGEGGLVVCSDEEVAGRIEQRLNFGFEKGGLSSLKGFNGKLSEYHCAVALASLDVLAQTLRSFQRVASVYRREIASADTSRLVTSPRTASCYALLAAPSSTVRDRWAEELALARIETRSWYRDGLSSNSIFSGVDRPDQEPPCVLGLPMSVRFSDEVAERVASAVNDVLSKVLENR